jgi:ergothioneine biosynthesis protein EgtB
MRAFTPVRQNSVALTQPLSPEDCGAQSMPDASPVKWHLAHTTWFFETFALARYEPHFRAFNDGFGFLFNSYYDAIGDRHPRAQRGLLTRPSLDEVYWYRRSVDERMGPLLARAEHDPKIAAVLALGLAHEEQHQELMLTDVLHLFAQNPLRPAYTKGAAEQAVAGKSEWHRIDGGACEIGADATAFSSAFSFDNERPRHRVWLEPFEIASRLVTVRELESFIRDEGYQRPELWLSDGFQCVQRERWAAPLYWQGDEIFTLQGVRKRDPDEAVRHLSYYEADAFARWSGARLPTEAEWEVAAAAGVLDQRDDVAWQWTSSAYTPYPGFVPFPGAFGEYNGKFMVNQYVLRGGSCVTPKGHTHLTYRNFFPAHARWQFAGVRLANDL